MKLIVLGATGGVGLEILRQALERQHSVTALVRDPSRLSSFNGRVRVVAGNPLSQQELSRALVGHDAVLSALGPRLPLAKSDDDLLTRFARALTSAMRESTVRRVVVLSTAFLFLNSLFPPAYLFGRLFFPFVVNDASAMEAIVTNSQLDWTLVRPPQFTNKPHTGNYRVREAHLPRFGFSIPRADVADYLLTAAADKTTRKKIIGLSA